MSFLTDEQSIAGSQPSELYAFVTPSASYYYTSGPIAVVFAGNTYVPLAGLKRAAIAGASANDPPQFTVTMPFDASLIQAEAFVMPSKSIVCTITRLQPSGSDVIWTGPVTAIQLQGRTATLNIPSTMDAALSSTVPGVAFQVLCSHQLYDTNCTVVEASFRITTTLTAFDGARTYTVASVGGNPDGYYNAGKLKRIADGEPRLIESHVGAQLTVSAPFKTWSPGQSITLSAGCGHDIFTCHNKFNNQVNYGGFTGIPETNPLASLQGLI